MSDDHLADLERALRGVPPMRDVPPHLVQACIDAALTDDLPTRAQPHRRRWRPGLWSTVAAATLAIGLGVGSLHTFGDRPGLQRIVDLQGSGSATGVVEVGPPARANAPVRVSISHLRPADAGHYYQMWVRTAAGDIPALAFNTAPGGSANLEFTAPRTTRWVTCWVSLETAGRPGGSRIVLRATPLTVGRL